MSGSSMGGMSGGGGGGNTLGMAIAGYNVVAGQVNLTKANAEANYLEKTKPVRKTSQFDRDALNLAQSDLANGMSAEAEQAYDDANDKSLASSISAILKSGGSANNIADMYDSSAQAQQNMAIIRENMRMKKVDAYLAELDTMAEEDSTNWLVNEYGPYINKVKAVGEARKAAAAQTAKGLDSLGGSGSGGKDSTAPDDDDAGDMTDAVTSRRRVSGGGGGPSPYDSSANLISGGGGGPRPLGGRSISGGGGMGGRISGGG